MNHEVAVIIRNFLFFIRAEISKSTDFFRTFIDIFRIPCLHSLVSGIGLSFGYPKNYFSYA